MSPDRRVASSSDMLPRAVSRRDLLRFGVAAAAATTVAPALAACGGPSQSASDSSPGSTVTLKVVGFEVTPSDRGTPLEQAYKKFLADFQAQHPKIKIDSLATPPDFDTQIIVDLASGTAPDLWAQDASSLAPLIQRKLILDMRECQKVLPDLKFDRFFPNVMEIHNGSGGAVYGLPNDFTPMVVFYNPLVFSKAAVQPPKPGWTWEDQLRMAQRLTLDSKGRNRLDPDFDEHNVVQWGYRARKYAFEWVYRVWQNGSDVISKDGKTASGYLDSSASVEAIQWYADLVLKHKVSPNPSTLDSLTQSADFDSLFLQGRFAMFDRGHWELVGMQHSKDYKSEAIAVVGQPRKKTDATVFYESSFVIRHGLSGDKLKAAAQFVNAATDRQYQDTKAITGIALSANKDAAQAAVKDGKSQFPRLDPVFIDVTSRGRRPYGSRLAKYPTVETLLDSMMDRILHGSPVKDEVGKTVQQVNRELATR
jgi:multiple sugar transport system substrate-binding protein